RLVAVVGERHDLAAPARSALLSGLCEGRCLAAIDGLDEVPAPRRPSLDAALDAFVRRHPGAALLVSSRRTGYSEPPFPLRDEDELQLLPLDDRQLEAAVRRWF